MPIITEDNAVHTVPSPQLYPVMENPAPVSETETTSLEGFISSRASSHEQTLDDPIAIVGMAMRLPGKVNDADAFWKFLVEKRTGLCDVPKDRFNIDGFYDPSGKPGTLKMKQGYYLQDVNLQDFDTSFFSLSKTELERLDPQQRQLLEVTYECMENSGATSWRGSNIGCYVGVFGEDWQDLNAKETQHRGGYRVTGYGDFVLGNRVSYEFDLGGPSMTVKTGCSSSLVCLDMACEAIRKGDCDGALVCGTSMIFSPTMYLALSDQGVLSPTGTCKTFDASADGYGRGEGVNAIYIKRLSEAIRDGDSIRAVIRGTSVNCDGHTQGMLTPSPLAQEALIRRTYEQAGITNLGETAMVECHGTGTAVGDPLETAAVAKCFGKEGVVITSVKPNVGHSEGAAGITSLIKAVLAIEHRMIPPNIHFNNPNPDIPFESCKLHVPVEVEEWPQGRAERVSVNSFGIGGVNAHVIVESLSQYESSQRRSSYLTSSNPPTPQLLEDNGTIAISSFNNLNKEQLISETITEIPIDDFTNIDVKSTNQQQQLLLFSAHSEHSLQGIIDAYQKYLPESTESLQDVAYTLATRREHKGYRAYAVTGDGNTINASAPIGPPDTAPRVAWVFTGQGAQWAEMGAELIDTNVVFGATIRKLDAFLLSLPSPPPWTIEDELRKTVADSRVQKAEMGHPLSIAVQIGLIDMLRAWKVEPDFVLGHSSGEMAAAYASGSITAEGAMAAATFRGSSSTGAETEQKGSMAAIGLGSHEMAPYMESGVVIACENSQCSVTISGDAEQVEKVVDTIKEQRPGVLARFLKVEKAFHSHHMLAYSASYEEHIQPFVTSVNPTVPFYSSVTGKRLSGDGCLGASYWRQNMESPVLFNTALRSALADREERLILIEIGPHPALKGPIGQILRDMERTEHIHLGTLQRNKSCDESLNHLAGKLFQESVDVDFASVLPPGGQNANDLPPYVWKRDTAHWAESRIASEWRFRKYAPHDLLGARVVEVSNEPCWRNKLALEDVPWLTGHEVNKQIVFPAAGYICMIGEAIRQIESETTYTLRNVSITTGLMLEHSKTVELSTVLHQIGDDQSEFPWYSFQITSFDGTKWVKHCAGEARASVDKSTSLNATRPSTDALPRRVDEAEWYGILNRIGFNYQGLFKGLRHISSATLENRSVATVSPTQKGMDEHRGKYAIHPGIIDQCFQLFTVSACRGLGRNCINIAVPTFIEEIVVSPALNDLAVRADILNAERGSFLGNLEAQVDGKIALLLRGFKASALSSTDSAEDQVPLVTEMKLRPHADFVRTQDYMHPRTGTPEEWLLLEELMLLCMFHHQESIKLTDTTQPHLVKFFSWMEEYINSYKAGNRAAYVAKEVAIAELTTEERLARIDSIAAEVEATEWSPFALAIHRLFKEADAIYAGDTHPLHVLVKDDVLTDFYAIGDTLNYGPAIQMLAHTNPRMRILEVGAGTGGTTAKILDSLRSSSGERMYASYVYTDISAGFMNAAKERFADAENMEYLALDITQDPVEQGFVEGSFDLIIGSNVVHATPSLNATLSNLKSLLSPNGRLLLLELCSEFKFVNYVMGFLQGWWLGAEDGRPNEPYVGLERWTEELVKAGFKEPDAFVLDRPSGYHNSAGIIASPAFKPNVPGSASILCYDSTGPYVQEIRDILESRGVATTISIFGQPNPAGQQQDVISLLDLQEATVHDFSEETYKTLVGHLLTLKSRMIWVTRSAQVGCEDPRTAMTLGFVRTARSELSAKIFTVEIDKETDTSVAGNAILDILIRSRSPELDSQVMDRDWEFAIVKGEILIARCHWQTMSRAFAQSPGAQSSGEHATKKYLTVKTPGLLRTMGWGETHVEQPGQGQVLVHTKAVGLNFRDVLIALGVLDNSTREIGLEGCGVIAAVGSGVERLAVGDRVMYMSSGCFTSHLTLSQTLCVKIDESMTFEQGAALPCVYATAAMALTDKANLQRGQSILIHSACGGVGLAAIQIAQMLGAEIYCTVGNEEKINYLIDNHAIPRTHIFNSRDSSFLGDVMRATGNKGVDVVLNSLSGELLQASWKCVAEFGTMIEIGKRDFRRRAKLSMEAFEQNRTFVGLDLWQVSQVRPEKAAELLERCMDWIRAGLIKPGVIAKAWEASQTQEAFRFMQSGKHIGKIIVNMPEHQISNTDSSTELSADKPSPALRSDRSYLLVGGLGGLGRAVATWMVEQGARHLIFLSRSASSGAHLNGFEEELASQGCQTQLVAGSVTNMADVEKAVQEATMPIAGVINLSMVLRDVSLRDATFRDWQAVVTPKVQGTWNLHNAISTELDFFILCSSYSGIVGQWGQANYAAANTFLDAFVQFRHHKGLAASVINIGVMGEVGYVWKNRDILELFKKSGMRILKEQELLDAMNLAIQRSQPAQQVDATGARGNPSQMLLGLITTTPVASPNNRVVWRRDARMGIYHNINSVAESTKANSAEKDSIESLLASAAAHPEILDQDSTTAIIAKTIAQALANFLIKEEDSIRVEHSPEHIGVDSLVAMELCNWVRQKFSVETSVMVIVQSNSLVDLADHIRKGLIERMETE